MEGGGKKQQEVEKNSQTSFERIDLLCYYIHIYRIVPRKLNKIQSVQNNTDSYTSSTRSVTLKRDGDSEGRLIFKKYR